MKIALDVDGVLADVIISWINYNNTIRPKILKNEITSWDFWKKFNINQYDFYEELSNCWKNWPSIPPTEDKLSEFTKKLSTVAQVDIVTARERYTDSFVKKWLKQNDIIFENYVSVISGPMKANLDYDVFIDDSPLNALKIIEKNKTIFLYSQPWNQKICDSRSIRINNLHEVFEKL